MAKKSKEAQVVATANIMGFKKPSHTQRMKEAVKDSMVSSTRQWCMGEIDNKRHKDNIKRAKKALDGGM
jgi:hypothetical protein